MKKLILLICVFSFGINANAQMTTAVITAGKYIEDRPATGTSDNDYPSIDYVQEGQKVLTIGQIKKITSDYIVGLGYKVPKLIEVKEYKCARWGEYRKWVFAGRCRSKKFPGKDIVNRWQITQIYENGRGWQTKLKRITGWLVSPSMSDAMALNEEKLIDSRYVPSR